MLRSIGAVVAGYFIFASSGLLLFQLSGQDPHRPAPLNLEIAAIIWGCVFALVAGWLTARIAPRRPATHAAILAALIATGAVVSLVASPPGAIWSQVSALVAMAPCAWLGGRVAARTPAGPAVGG